MPSPAIRLKQERLTSIHAMIHRRDTSNLGIALATIGIQIATTYDHTGSEYEQLSNPPIHGAVTAKIR